MQIFSKPLAAVALLGLLHAAGCAPKVAQTGLENAVRGSAGHAELPLWRSPSGRKVFVEADLGDGKPRLFLLDTGADISVLSAESAAELGIVASDSGAGALAGLGGRVQQWKSAIVPEVGLGPYGVTNVMFAVGLPGIPERVGMAPLAGILGNNVWSHFQVVVDYPANTLELWRDGLPIPETASSLWFDGSHIRTWATLEMQPPDGGPAVRHAWTVEVDTGATGLLLYGDQQGDARPLLKLARPGEEPIFGVGADAAMPLSTFMQQTLRLPVVAVELGGARIEEAVQTSWLPDPGNNQPLRLQGLAGHELFDEHRLILDYLGRSIALAPSTRPPVDRDVHAWALDQLKRARTRDDRLARARLNAGLGHEDEARGELRRLLREDPDDTDVRVLLARLERFGGEAALALEHLSALPVEALVDQGEILAVVNSTWLAGDRDAARTLADRAVAARPDDPGAWLALSDIARVQHDLATARSSLRTATKLTGEPDSHLLRRALLAQAEGDLHGAITHLRRMIQLYPGAPVTPWIYAWTVRQTAEADLAIEDLDKARERLHDGEGPLDFLAAAYRLLNRPDLARSLMDAGIARDCGLATEAPDRQNCEAWYRAVAGVDLDGARTRIDAAVQARPQNHQFLDTLAVVLEAQGAASAARDAAWAAARTNPEDVYLLWQADRLAAAATDGG